MEKDIDRSDALRVPKAAVAVLLGSMLGWAGAAHALDSDRVEGTGKEVKGTVEQKAGQLTGDKSLEAQGRDEHAQGVLEDAWGKVKDAARDVADAIQSKLGGK